MFDFRNPSLIKMNLKRFDKFSVVQSKRIENNSDFNLKLKLRKNSLYKFYFYFKLKSKKIIDKK